MGVPYSQGMEAGRPAIDRDSCTVCGACVLACPIGVLTEEAGDIRIDAETAFGCIACAHCMMVCPSDSIQVRGRRFQPSDLVDLPPRDRRATTDQLESLLISRRSVRRFKPDEVPREAIERVVAAATMAPMGIPPWDVGVIVFHGREKVRELAWDAADTYSGFLRMMDNGIAKGLLRLFAKRTSYQAMVDFILPLGRKLVTGKSEGIDLVLYGAPTALLFYASPYADGADPFIACTYAMLEAQTLGLGTTMIGCVSPPLARRKELLRKYGLPRDHMPKIVLVMGYPSIEFLKGVRRSFSAVKWY